MCYEEYRPFFSIIIPAYQAAGVIDRALESVITQACPSWEIIIVDDGSRDNLSEVVGLWGDKRIRLVSVPNGGPAKARNTGIGMAKGEYILFLDADDSFLPGCFEKLQEQLSHRAVDLLLFGFELYQKKSGSTYHNYHAEADYEACTVDELPITDFYQRNLLNQVWNKAYRRAFLVENELQMPDYRYGEDRLFVFACLSRAQTVSVSGREWYRYCIENEDSLIHSWHDNKFEICVEIHHEITRLAEKTAGYDPSVLNYMFAKSVFSCLSDGCGNKSPLTVRQQISHIKHILHHEDLKQALRDCRCPNWPTSLVLFVMRSRLALVNYLFIKVSTGVMGYFPSLMIQLKHRQKGAK